MHFLILDLGFDVNIITKKTWENMGKPKLVCPNVQLIFSNQQKEIPFNIMISIPIKVEVLQTFADFEVIDITDYTNPYPSLLGIY